MCETGLPGKCRKGDAFLVTTNRVANPGQTRVTLYACADHLIEAVTDQLSNNRRLGEQGMRRVPGYGGSTGDGVTVVVIAPSCAICGELLEQVNVNGPDEWVHADTEPTDRHAPILSGTYSSDDTDDIADAIALSRIESSACDC